MLVGGNGTDQLNDSSSPVSGYGDDIMIGGRTSYDSNKAAIDEIMLAWLSSATFVNRVNQLTTPGVGAGSYKLNISTVFDDALTDSFFGGIGLDWYLARLTIATGKEITNATGAEVGQQVDV